MKSYQRCIGDRVETFLKHPFDKSFKCKYRLHSQRGNATPEPTACGTNTKLDAESLHSPYADEGFLTAGQISFGPAHTDLSLHGRPTIQNGLQPHLNID